MQNVNNVIAMIPAAGRGSRMLALTDDMPKAMLPIRSKPIIGWHLDKLIEENIKDVIIIVGYKKEKLIDYVNKIYKNKINIRFVEQTELNGLASAVNIGINCLNKNEIENKKLLIILGDTLITDKFDKIFNNSFVGYKNVEDYKRWCLLETDEKNNITKFFDKPNLNPNTKKAIIGIYYFNNIKLLNTNINTIIKNNIKIKNEYQLSSAMDLYIKEENIKAIEFNKWYDCGQLDTFNQTKKNIARCFNQITLTDDNTIIKQSDNEKKLHQEINWFLNLPNKLKVYIPQLIDYSILKNNTFYELEYINFSPMQELFLYNLPLMEQWNNFFNVLFNMIDKFKLFSNKCNFNTKQHLKNILITKTVNRVNELQENPYFKELSSTSGIKINGIYYKNLNTIWNSVLDYLNKNIIDNSSNYWQIIHGDLFFGNMLYDIGSRTLKIIDPRGNFHIDGNYGDIRYDIAKMNHSIVGKYDFIVNDLFAIIKDDINKNEFEYILYDSNKHKEITKIWKQELKNRGYNYNDILIITALLFLSMIPLHSENVQHQKMFYFISIQLFNEVF